MTEHIEGLVEITQADRELAAMLSDENDHFSILKGDLDGHPLVQASIRDRLASGILARLVAYAVDWRDRAMSKDIVIEAAGLIATMQEREAELVGEVARLKSNIGQIAVAERQVFALCQQAYGLGVAGDDIDPEWVKLSIKAALSTLTPPSNQERVRCRMMQDDAARVAAGLTERQINAVLRFRPSNDGKHMHHPVYRDMGRMQRELEALGICGPSGIMSKFGQAVATILKGEDDD